MADILQPLGDVGNVFLFENDQAKVWELVLEPGQQSLMHHHTMDYLFVVVEGGRLRTEYQNGSFIEDDYAPGDVEFNTRCSTHRVVNVGTSRWRNVIIEIKEESDG